MNVKLPTTQQLGSWLRQAAAVAGIVVSLGNQLSLPTSVRTVVLAISGAILGVEHYVSDPSTGSTPPKDPS